MQNLHEESHIQSDFLEPSKLQAFETWVHTPFGGWVADKFIHLALRAYRANHRQTGRGIWEDVREMYMNADWRGFPPPPEGSAYALNDHHYPYLVRFAVDRCPELANFLKVRKCGRPGADLVAKLHVEVARLRPDNAKAARAARYSAMMDAIRLGSTYHDGSPTPGIGSSGTLGQAPTLSDPSKVLIGKEAPIGQGQR